ncbi:prolyl 4-hydroxylase subunit alpha-1-like isoform X2 [Xenia sp. Carnegie-2017]|uniref:prolyl 4-hydroxylase subunit alpha-1-like isoform X2 n=1 Tax=Xenia sp. Carnegie-2017 TaxID=2897299 RepID=UPI001F0492CC|nr:prolyl 4-hydroxylase subunit alpha-1-like isoform X2 [Xenia sp. Carnegie-2017]
MAWLFSWLRLSLFWYFLVCVRSEVFTALIEMENLVYREKEMLDSLKGYLQAEQDRLEVIKRFTEKLDQIHSAIPQENVERHLGHPSNSYLLIKRFVKEWPAIEELSKNPSSEILEDVLNKHRNLFPDESDFEGAIDAIFRVQEIFKVKSLDLAKDNIPSETRGFPMMTNDAFEIGKTAYESEKYEESQKWLETAVTLWKEGLHTNKDNMAEILDYLSYVEYKLGHLRKAYNLTLTLLTYDPSYERAQKNLRYYADELKSRGQLTGEKGVLRSDDTLLYDEGDESNIDVDEETSKEKSWRQSKAFRLYSKLCRSDPETLFNFTVSQQQQLKCWFYKDKPWLHLRGIGVERLHVAPEVLYFRNVLTDFEIEVIKRLGRPKLKRAVIQHPETGNLEPADYRISKSGWLKDSENPVVARISRRSEHLTGLTFSTAEELQVNTYGMGGHYEPHYDHAQGHEDKFSDLGTGNRIATLLFYMSDVELGGGTAFINVGALVQPRKGDGVFWFNLHKNGKGNLQTRHAACPVFVGTKWVANKWIHEKGQEFRHKCSLNHWE